MSLDSVLKKLESRIEEFVEAHQVATARIAELEGRIAELEGQLGGSGELEAKIAKLESQREELAERLGKVLGVLDKASRRRRSSPGAQPAVGPGRPRPFVPVPSSPRRVWVVQGGRSVGDNRRIGSGVSQRPGRDGRGRNRARRRAGPKRHPLMLYTGRGKEYR
jgi:hypothetical protein